MSLITRRALAWWWADRPAVHGAGSTRGGFVGYPRRECKNWHPYRVFTRLLLHGNRPRLPQAYFLPDLVIRVPASLARHPLSGAVAFGGGGAALAAAFVGLGGWSGSAQAGTLRHGGFPRAGGLWAGWGGFGGRGPQQAMKPPPPPRRLTMAYSVSTTACGQRAPPAPFQPPRGGRPAVAATTSKQHPRTLTPQSSFPLQKRLKPTSSAGLCEEHGSWVCLSSRSVDRSR
jgi:hypothetical protein